MKPLKLSTFISCVMIMTGCGPATSERTDFEQYLDAIPELELPLTIRCDGG